MIRLASLLLVALSASPALAGEAKEGPSEAARAVAALEGRLADLLKEGTAYEHADRYEALLAEASQVAGKHAGEPDAARAYLVIARCCEALGKHPEKEVAFQHYVEALAKYSKEEAATALRREIDGLVGRRELYVAIKTIQLMLSKFPDGPEAAYALYRLGTCHLWMDQPDEAVPAFAEMLQRWPESEVAVQARLRLARCYFCR